MPDTRTVSILVKGRVQGVWYRASARSEAKRLKLTGFVSNMKDGSVYIEASGSNDAIQQFIDWCKRGPELARVDTVEVDDIDRKPFDNFEIRR